MISLEEEQDKNITNINMISKLKTANQLQAI